MLLNLWNCDYSKPRMHITFSWQTYSKSEGLFTFYSLSKKTHSPFSSKIWYSRNILIYEEFTCHRINKWKLFLPFCSELSISHRLSVGLGVWFSVFGLIRLGFYNPRKPSLPLSSRQASGVHLSLSFTDFTDCRPYHSRGLDLGGWGLYLRAHHRDYLQLYRHRDWLCHYLLSSAPIRSCLCPVCRQQAHLRQVHRLAR